MTDDLQKLAQRLRQDRERAGLSIRALAEASGVFFTNIARLEAAKIENPRPDYLRDLARALKVDPEDYYAYAGYLDSQGLPELQPYLRAKYNLPPQATRQIDEYFQALRDRWTQTTKENDHDDIRDEAA